MQEKDDKMGDKTAIKEERQREKKQVQILACAHV